MVDLPVPASPLSQKTQDPVESSTHDMTSSRRSTRVFGVHPSVVLASHVAEERGLRESSKSKAEDK
jgi:hypothetical protein